MLILDHYCNLLYMICVIKIREMIIVLTNQFLFIGLDN
jgi:hypothetical protein